MNTLYRDILIGLMFFLGIAGVILGEFIISLVLFITAYILKSSNLYIENNVA